LFQKLKIKKDKEKQAAKEKLPRMYVVVYQTVEKVKGQN